MIHCERLECDEMVTILPGPEKLQHIHPMSCAGGGTWLVDCGNEICPARADVACPVCRAGRLGVSAEVGAEVWLSDQPVVRGAGVW